MLECTYTIPLDRWDTGWFHQETHGCDKHLLPAYIPHTLHFGVSDTNCSPRK